MRALARAARFWMILILTAHVILASGFLSLRARFVILFYLAISLRYLYSRYRTPCRLILQLLTIAFLRFGFRSGLNLLHYHLLTLPARLAQLELDSECKCKGQKPRSLIFYFQFNKKPHSYTYKYSNNFIVEFAFNFYFIKLKVWLG